MSEYDLDRVNSLLRNLTPRKISIISRLAGLNGDEIQMMRLKWLDGKSDAQICDIMGISQATLSRKRRHGHIKLIDAMDLYGLSDLESLPANELFDYEGLFYQAQDQLVKYFLKHAGDEKAQSLIVRLLTLMCEQ